MRNFNWIEDRLPPVGSRVLTCRKLKVGESEPETWRVSMAKMTVDGWLISGKHVDKVDFWTYMS